MQQKQTDEIKINILKELGELEKNASTYINPWGITGGLFGSVLLVFVFISAYSIGGLDKFDLFIITAIALANGYLHSLTISDLNKETALNAMNFEMTKKVTKISEKMAKTIMKQHVIIKEQKVKIKKLKETQGIYGVETHGK